MAADGFLQNLPRLYASLIKLLEGSMVGPRTWAMHHEARGIGFDGVRSKNRVLYGGMAAAVERLEGEDFG